MKTAISIKELCHIAVFTAIIAVVSQLSVPMPAGVPMTLQTFIVPMAAVVIGTRNGTLSTMLYILLGAVGLPVFAGMRGGIDALLGPTGGFIFSFPFMALITGVGYTLAIKISGKINKKAAFYGVFLVGQLLGVVFNYLIGMLWFSKVTGNSMAGAFVACVAPFIVTSVIKMMMVTVLGPVLKKRMVRSGVLEIQPR
jgi:biotin transport system substrate-specific component